MATKTWEITAPDGRHWTIDAPVDVPLGEVVQFAKENADSWQNGARYAMESTGEVVPSAATVAPTTTPAREPTRNEQADAAVARLNHEIAAIDDEIADLATRGERSALLSKEGGGRYDREQIQQYILDLTKYRRGLKEERDRLSIGRIGGTVGGVGGSLVGAGAGALLGSPLGLPGIAGGALIGALAVGAGGEYAGTRLWDIPEAQQARDISDEEAAKLAQDRAIEALVWDAGFTLLLGPGGVVIGKLARGSGMVPALKAAAKFAVPWDTIAKSKTRQMERAVESRAKEAPPLIGSQVSEALGITPPVAPEEATKNVLREIAERSGGRVPTKGEMRGQLSITEQNLLRTQAPRVFYRNDRALADTAESIRDTALSLLDRAGAYDPLKMGEAIKSVRENAMQALREQTRPIFQAAANANVTVPAHQNLRLQHLIKAHLKRSIKLKPTEVGYLESRVLQFIKDRPNMNPADLQDLISSMKSEMRRLSDDTEPSEFMKVVLGDTIEVADDAFARTIMQASDPELKQALDGARKLWKDTLGDLYSDTLAKIARKTPEDVGTMLVSAGGQTEIRDLRKALHRAVSTAPGANKAAVTTEIQRIDAGMVKGFIEEQTKNLTGLEIKLSDPKFLRTLKELMTGPGAARPELNAKVLAELDKAAAAIKIIRPERAPLPGRSPVPGVGGIGGASLFGFVGNIGAAVAAALSFITGARLVSHMAAMAMTTGNLGVIRRFNRALALAPAAGKNVAAAEALLEEYRTIKDWYESSQQGVE